MFKNNINTLSCNYEKFFKKIFYILLFILIIIPVIQIPMYYLSNIDWYLNYNLFIESIAQISLLFLMAFISYKIYTVKHFILDNLKNDISLIFLILFIFWTFISSISSKDISLAFNGSDYRHEGFFMYVYYVVFFLLSLSIKNNNKKINLTKVNSLCSSLVSLMVIYQYINPLNSRCVSTNLTGVFFHFNHCGYYLALSAIATSVLLVISSRLITKVMYSLLLIIQISALIINDTFGAYLAVLLTLIILIFLFKYNKNFCNSSKDNVFSKYIPLIILIIVTLILNLLVIGNFIDNFSSLFSDIGSLFNRFFNKNTPSYGEHKKSTGTERIKLWKAAIKYAIDHPLLGSGLEQLAPYYSSLNYMQTKPANEYLYILTSCGFPGFILYMSWICRKFINKIKGLNSLSNVELIGILCSIGYLISAFFGNSTFYITPYFLIFLAFI